MELEFREVICQGANNMFSVYANGTKYLFTFANSTVYEYLVETEKPVDCSQYVLDCQELFAEIAEDMIAKDSTTHHHLIDAETFKRYFNC
ncbi:MAG TPA: hypothetical protein VFF75_03675 [Methylophilaceae bacterium]|nr:hypothetical protein [Methylophilaceae bacterium]